MGFNRPVHHMSRLCLDVSVIQIFYFFLMFLTKKLMLPRRVQFVATCVYWTNVQEGYAMSGQGGGRGESILASQSLIHLRISYLLCSFLDMLFLMGQHSDLYSMTILIAVLQNFHFDLVGSSDAFRHFNQVVLILFVTSSSIYPL